jgi:hypothetical protein
MSKSIRADIFGCRLAGIIRLLATAVLAGALPATAFAHGFGQRYDLPLPLTLYLYGTAAVVAVSFVIVGLFVRHPAPGRGYPRWNLLAHPFGRWIANPSLIQALRLVSLALFVVTVTAGFLGDQNPYRNIAPTMVWIVAWVGLAYVSAFVGDVWVLINPWRTTFEWAERLFGWIAGGRGLSVRLPYPEALGVWPAVVLLLAFAWFELVYPSASVPAQIAFAASVYSILTWAGMVAFGRETWLRHGEVFSVVFGTYARFAPTEARSGPSGPELNLRPFGAGLLDPRMASPSMTAFVLLLLATVLFDGLLSTPEWASLERAVAMSGGGAGDLEPMLFRSVGLLGFWLLFLGAYLAVSAIMSAVTGRSHTMIEIARSFAFTLVPIAIGYHLAHYLVFLLVQGQYIIPLLSDPLGYGWDLFGTAGYRVDIAVVGSRFAWYAAVIAILIGHIVAVYLAHVKAMRLFSPRRIALQSQVPLTALMVIYTFVSLSILAEPIVERPTPAQPSVISTAGIAIPADAVLPEPGSGRLQPTGPDKFAREKLTYRVLGSAFHDGTRMNHADILYAYAFAYRSGTRSETREAHYDPFVDVTTARMRRQLAGLRVAEADTVSQSFRIADVNIVREVFTVDVYTERVSDDPERDAILLPPWSTLPWHLIALMEESVGRGWAAFSQVEAARRGVEWLDLVRSGRMNTRLASLVETFAREGYRPAALQSWVSADEARKRWAALAGFYKTHGHFLVANGPYRLKRWTADSITLEAFRDPTYPLGVGSYDAYATPRRGYITGVQQEGNRITLSGDIETVVKAGRSQRIVREPMRSIAPTVLQRAAPRCRYVVTNDAGDVVLAGAVAPSDDLTFQVDLSGKLAAGRYNMSALIAVNDNVMNADIRRIPVRIP